MQPVALLVQACTSHGGFPPDDKRIHATVTDGTQRLATFCQHLHGCPAFVGSHLPRLWDFVASVISLAQQEEPIVESSLKVIMCALAIRLSSCGPHGDALNLHRLVSSHSAAVVLGAANKRI